MEKRLGRFSEVAIADETNGFGPDFVKKTEWILERHYCFSARLILLAYAHLLV